MAFTYDLSSVDATVLLISKLRLEIGDTSSVEGEGILPSGRSFTDAELQAFLSRASNDLMVAAAYVCNALSNSYARFADVQVGPRRESLSQIASRYEKRAAYYIKLSGTGSRAFSTGFNRNDGYEALDTGDYN